MSQHRKAMHRKIRLSTLRRMRAAASSRILIAILGCIPCSAIAQIAAPIDNISPMNSDRDARSPGSASGGRVNQMSIHPTNASVAFAASEWGGLFRTDDRGRTWSPVEGHLPQATWDVEFDPSNGNVVIATSFFDGKVNQSRSGINVSRDGGRTWTVPPTARPEAADCRLVSARNEPAAFGIAFDPATSRNIYVGTNCGLAVSTDNGATWDFIDPTPGDGGGLNIYDVIVHNGILDICGDDGHQRSTNNGRTFVDGANEVAGRCSLAVSPDEDDVLFLSVGTSLFESRDGGASWPGLFTFQQGLTQGRIPFVRVNDRTGSAYDLWYGDVILLRASCTTPASTTSTARRCPQNAWTNANDGAHADVGDLAFDPTRAVDACPILFSNDGGVYWNQRTDSTCHDPRWEQPTRSVSALWLWDLDGVALADADEEGIYTGQQDTGAFGTRGGPTAAPDWKSASCCDVFDVEAETDRMIYTTCCISGGRRTRLYLDDGTMTGTKEISAYPTGNLIAFNDTDSIVGYAPDSYALITRSPSTGAASADFTTDIGASPVVWKALGTNVPNTLCGIAGARRKDGTPVFFGRAGGCDMGTSGALWRLVGASSTATWERIERGGSSNFGAFGVDPNNPDRLLAADLSSAVPTMVRTRDGGRTWTVLRELDGLLTGHGEFPPWTRTGPGFGGSGYPQASLAAISPADPDLMVVGGQDAGVFLSRDGGNRWRRLTDPFGTSSRPHISRPLFAHFETPNNGHTTLYIGTRGRGIWRLAIDHETGITTSDLNGDGTQDIQVASGWGIGTLTRQGAGLDTLALKPNGTRFDGWMLDTRTNRLEVLANLDNDRASEMIFTSGWGVGVLEQTGDTYRALFLDPNGTRYGGWILDTEKNRFGPVGDFDGDGRDEVLITSGWGIGIFELDSAGTSFDVPFLAPNGARLGDWMLDTAKNRFGPVGDFDHDGRDEILVVSGWGIGVLELESGVLRSAALKPNGTDFGGWLLDTVGNRFGPVGDFDADRTDDIVVTSGWGIGVLELRGDTFTAKMLKPNGTDFGGWILDTTSDHSWAAGNFAAADRDDLFVAGRSGIAVLTLDTAGGTFRVSAAGTDGARYGGWILSTRTNHFRVSRDLTGDRRADILVTSGWGLGILTQSGSTFDGPILAANSTSLGGWRLSTAENTFW